MPLSVYHWGTSLRIRTFLTGLLTLLTAALLALAPVAAKPASGGYQLFEPIVLADQHAIQLAALENFDYHAKIAPECCNAPKGGGGFYDPRAWRQNYEDFYNGNVTSTTVPPYSAPNVRLAGQAHPRTGVVFDQRGFPIFDDVARYDTRFPAGQFRATDYQGQMRMATRDLCDTIVTNSQLRSRFIQPQLNAIEGGKAKIPDFTWHHHQDTGRMQLVPSVTHRSGLR